MKKPQHKLREIHFEYDEREKDFRLYKIWNKKTKIETPFLIVDTVEELVEHLEELITKYKCRVDHKKLKQYISTYS